jgi:hypothetical protein
MEFLYCPCWHMEYLYFPCWHGISLLSMLTYGIPSTFGRFDTNFIH